MVELYQGANLYIIKCKGGPTGEGQNSEALFSHFPSSLLMTVKTYLWDNLRVLSPFRYFDLEFSNLQSFLLQIWCGEIWMNFSYLSAMLRETTHERAQDISAGGPSAPNYGEFVPRAWEHSPKWPATSSIVFGSIIFYLNWCELYLLLSKILVFTRNFFSCLNCQRKIKLPEDIDPRLLVSLEHITTHPQG